MATIVNNPASNNSGGPMGIIIALIILLILAVFVFVYGIPLLQQMQSGGTQIIVPDKIDVNVKQTK